MNIQKNLTEIITNADHQNFSVLLNSVADKDLGRIIVLSYIAQDTVFGDLINTPGLLESNKVCRLIKIYCKTFFVEIVDALFNNEALADHPATGKLLNGLKEMNIRTPVAKTAFCVRGDFALRVGEIWEFLCVKITSECLYRGDPVSTEYVVDALRSNESLFFTKIKYPGSEEVDEVETVRRMRLRLTSRLFLTDILDCIVNRNPGAHEPLPGGFKIPSCKYSDFVESFRAGLITSEDLRLVQCMFVPFLNCGASWSGVPRTPFHRIPADVIIGPYISMLFH